MCPPRTTVRCRELRFQHDKCTRSFQLAVHGDRRCRRSESAQIFRNDKNFLNRFYIYIHYFRLFVESRANPRDFSIRSPFGLFSYIFRFRRIYIVSRLNVDPCSRCTHDLGTTSYTLHTVFPARRRRAERRGPRNALESRVASV